MSVDCTRTELDSGLYYRAKCADTRSFLRLRMAHWFLLAQLGQGLIRLLVKYFQALVSRLVL